MSDIAGTESGGREKRPQEIYIPLHGFVKLWDREIAVVNHPAFQRLRRVRQLGLAHAVFPGGTHTRFEHSIGAVHVAVRILDHIRENFTWRPREPDRTGWQLADIPDGYAAFIRLAALLHDVGHVPFGHTLEDELHHLDHHDGEDRLARVATVPHVEYELRRDAFPNLRRPAAGWSLRELVDATYAREQTALTLPGTPFDTLTKIVGKTQDDDLTSDQREWIRVCQDVIGNTICADFLDYLFRDWYHLGKPMHEDMRLYQYMEVREKDGARRFVINIGTPPKVRHDALTTILELLEARYKLAENVLFHRTKLSLIGLLDRCLLEIRALYQDAGVDHAAFKDALEGELVEGSDDGVPQLLEWMVGPDSSGGREVHRLVEEESKRLRKGHQEDLFKEAGGTPEGGPKVIGPIGARVALVRSLIRRLAGRTVYHLVHNLRISELPAPASPDNRRVKELIDLYSQPAGRQAFLQGLESLCDLPRGTLIMYCPPGASMNAKIARVNLLVDGDVKAFADYELEMGEGGLTGGALGAQIKRFYQLWGVSVYVERTKWDALGEDGREWLRAIVKDVLYHGDEQVLPATIRSKIDPLVLKLRSAASKNVAARSDTRDSAPKMQPGFVFPSGVPFELP